MPDYAELLPYCRTPRQIEIINTVISEGSMRAAAVKLNIANATVQDVVKTAQRRAALIGLAPAHDMTHTVPEGFKVKGVSTYYNKDGEKAGQWVKSSADEEAREAMLLAAIATLSEEVKGLAPITAPPAYSDDSIIAVYPMGDPHFGMYAWWQDAGEDFDLSIAESITKGAVDRLISTAPPASTAIMLGLGDMFHSDDQSNRTRQHGNQLDVDGRWAKVLRVGLLTMIHCIRRLLERHQTVIIRFNKGNHDDHTSQALGMMVDCYFHNEPRVKVELTPSPFWYYQFGTVLLGSTHGDTVKGADLMSIMATDMPIAWGSTKHRYFLVGHVHHSDVKEYRGGIVEYFRTLAARDAWHQGQGYRAGRDMQLVVYHTEFGEIERHRCDISMIKANPEMANG